MSGEAWRSRLVGASANPAVLWSAFLLVHLALGLLNLHAPEQPLGDVTGVYRHWAGRAVAGGPVVGIDEDWVYPALALLPMLAAGLLGDPLYAGAWLSMVLLLNAAAFAALVGARPRRGARRLAAAWWWLAFLLLLGPIALGRIDSVTVPLAILAVVVRHRRPAAGMTLLTMAAWIKLWPAALAAALVIVNHERMRLVAAAAAVTGLIVGIAIVLGDGSSLFSFIGGQTGRGLQVEAPVSLPWMWLAARDAAQVYYDSGILTFQVVGPGSAAAAALSTPLLLVAVLLVLLLGAGAVRAGAPGERVLAPLALALVVTLVAFNKVGSPQFVTWLAAPVILGLLVSRRADSFRVPAVMAMVAAGLTQLVYPYLYDAVVLAEPAILAVLTARNLLYFLLLGWALRRLWRLARRRVRL